jgi:hypothetical protein
MFKPSLGKVTIERVKASVTASTRSMRNSPSP